MGNINEDEDKQQQLTIIQLMQVIQERLLEIKKSQNPFFNFSEIEKKIASINNISQKFKNQKISNQEDRTFGCLFGCLIGDALGAYCQFNTRQIDQKTLNKAMKMGGGGVFNLRSGQFTDDSEMSYHLLKGLLNIDPNLDLKVQQNDLLVCIGKQYVKWLKSMPFDIGITCRTGIQILKKNLQTLKIESILSQVYKMNNKSQSNGSLMRITPMALFFHLINQSPQEHKHFIKSQIKLLHPNQNLTEAGYLWVVILFHLIRRTDNSTSTFKNIFQHAESINQNQQLKAWFAQSKQQKKMGAVTNMGWAKIAWTYGMNILYRLSTIQSQQSDLKFLQEIQSVIKQAGDSDTNACIVGGIIGAIIGFRRLPKKYLYKLMKLSFPSTTSEKLINDRPKQYEPFNVFITLVDFMQKCSIYKSNRIIKSNQVPQQAMI